MPEPEHSTPPPPQQQQQLTGVVIITLPPPDNPSKGKTITAYTLSDDNFSVSPPPEFWPEIPPPPPPPPENARIPDSTPRQLGFFRFGRPISLLSFLAISLVALFVWSSLTQEILWELPDSDEDRRNSNTTFLLPLHPKTGLQRNSGPGSGSGSDFEFKLGRFKNFRSGDVMKSVEIQNSVSAASKLNSADFPIQGNIYPDGLYYTYVLIGNPAKPYFLDVDTGSDLTWIQCDAPCVSCAKGAHPFYKFSKSNIVQPKDSYCVEVQKDQGNEYCETCNQCDYEIEYADQSSSLGVLLRDETQLLVANGTLYKSSIIFGCGYDQQGSLLDTLAKTDGILGLGRARISLPSQLASQGLIENVIGHCLSSDVVGGGYMFFGNEYVPHRHMSWVPLLDSPFKDRYQTEVLKMSYGGKDLSLDSTGQRIVVFDSGSSYTFFTKRAYKNLVSMLSDVSSKGFVQDPLDTTLPICWKAPFSIRSIADVRQFFKPLNLQFGSKWWIVSTVLQIPPESYLVLSNKGNVCLGILDGSDVYAGDGSVFILGDITLRGQLFVYDNVKQRIGWIKSNCATPKKFQTSPFSL